MGTVLLLPFHLIDLYFFFLSDFYGWDIEIILNRNGKSWTSLFCFWIQKKIFQLFTTKYDVSSEKAMVPYSSTLAWKIPWAEESGRLHSMGLPRVGHDCVFLGLSWNSVDSVYLSCQIMVSSKCLDNLLSTFFLREAQWPSKSIAVLGSSLDTHSFWHSPLWLSVWKVLILRAQRK